MIDIRCPACHRPLLRDPVTWRCAEGHGFDVAREHYVNLLLVQHKHSREPGDTPASLQARRAFLDAGHYAPLRDALVERLRRQQPAARTLLDLGCGEGHYTAAMASVVDQVIGLDIAKPAIRLAARRHRAPGLTWLVGSGAQLPIDDQTLDAVSCLFTPLHVGELSRVLRPGGLLLVAAPAADHLLSFRAGLFEQVQAHRPEKFVETLGEGFVLLDTVEVSRDLDLSATDLGHLLAMTPYAWKARPERREALARRPGLRTRAAFSLLAFARRKAPDAAGDPWTR